MASAILAVSDQEGIEMVASSPPVESETPASPEVEQYASLTDLGSKRNSAVDPYYSLRELLGKRIVLDEITIPDPTVNEGTANVRVIENGNAIGEAISITLPKASVAAIMRALPQLRGKKLTANVEQGKRGLRLA